MQRLLPARFALAAALAASVVAFSGCGAGDGVAARYKVTGKVTYKGQPVPKGKVNFIPEAESGRGAVGEIIDGVYSLTTQTPDDGALPGKYKVTITSAESDLSAAEAEAEKLAGAKGTVTDQVAVSKGQKKSSLPEKYAAFTSSPLTGDVKAQSNTIDFDLTD